MITKVLKLIYSFAIVALTAFVCGKMTQEGIGLWYNQTPKTAITPPNYVFPIIWNLLYLLLAVYLYLLLTLKTSAEARKAHNLFLLQLVLQIVWCRTFFVSGEMIVGLMILIAADFATVALIRATKDLNLKIYYLLWPYLLWLMYATLINLSYVYKNGALVMF